MKSSKKVKNAIITLMFSVVVTATVIIGNLFAWFTEPEPPESDGLAFSVVEGGGANLNISEIYFGASDTPVVFTDKDQLVIYPGEYITLKFKVMETINNFTIEVEEDKLTAEEFAAFFNQQRRDLISGEYALDENATLPFNPETVFPLVEYDRENGTYTTNEPVFRPSYPKLDQNAKEEVINASKTAYESALNNYLKDSTPYLADLLYRFLENNSMTDTLAFTLSETFGGEDYIFAEEPKDGKKLFAPYKNNGGTFTRANVTLDRYAGGTSEKVEKEYSLTIGYGTPRYIKNESGEILKTADPYVLSATIENTSLNEVFDTAKTKITPYSGRYYSYNYNCFIGSQFGVKFTSDAGNTK